MNFSKLIYLLLALFSGTIYAQDITIYEPNEDLLCISQPYTYVAQLDQATSFVWEVENPSFSPQPEFTVSGTKNDTVSIIWYVPSFVLDYPTINIIRVTAMDGNTVINTLELYVENIIEAPSPLPSQQITQAGDTIACGDMTTLFSYSYPPSTQQVFSGIIEPSDAGEVVISSQWPPLSDPVSMARIYWNESFTGSATVTVTTSNACNSSSEEYHYYKESTTDSNNSNYYISGANTPCETLTSYSVTDSLSDLDYDISILPENATELVLFRDSLYIVDGNPLEVRFIDIYWQNGYSGPAQLIVHSNAECSASGSITNYYNVDTFNISICEDISATKFISNDKIEKMEIFPNPINCGNTIYWDIDIKSPASIDIIQISSGQTIQKGKLANSNSGFSLSNQLPSGLYMVKISLDNGQKQFYDKLVISK